MNRGPIAELRLVDEAKFRPALFHNHPGPSYPHDSHSAKEKTEAQKGEATGLESHTSSSSHLQVRAGKENPRVSVGEGGLS